MSTNQRSLRKVVDFPLNIPVTVALKYPHGKTVSSQYGERFMFTLADNRVMFLDPEVAQQITALGVNVRESFAITLKSDAQNGSTRSWEVARIAGEQQDGTLLIPKLPPASTGRAETDDCGRKLPTSALVDEANVLVDSFAQVLERSLSLYQGRIKPDEVKTLLVTAYIQRRQLSSVA